MAGTDITVEILKDIRDDIRGLRGDQQGLRGEFQAMRVDMHGLRDEVHGMREEVTQRLDTVESTLLDLAQQQRFIVRHTRTLAERDSRLDTRVTD